MVDYKEVLLNIEGFFFIIHLFYSEKDLLGAEGGGRGAFYQLNSLLIFVNSWKNKLVLFYRRRPYVCIYDYI